MILNLKIFFSGFLFKNLVLDHQYKNLHRPYYQTGFLGIHEHCLKVGNQNSFIFISRRSIFFSYLMKIFPRPCVANIFTLNFRVY